MRLLRVSAAQLLRVSAPHVARASAPQLLSANAPQLSMASAVQKNAQTKLSISSKLPGAAGTGAPAWSSAGSSSCFSHKQNFNSSTHERLGPSASHSLSPTRRSAAWSLTRSFSSEQPEDTERLKELKKNYTSEASLNEEEMKGLGLAMKKLQEVKDKLAEGTDTAEVLNGVEEVIGFFHGGTAHAAGSQGEMAIRPTEIGLQTLSEARFLAGSLCQHLNRWTEALEHFSAALRDCADFAAKVPAFYFGCGTSHAVLGNLEPAIKYLQKCKEMLTEEELEEMPSMRVSIPLQIGQCYVRFGNYSNAIEALKEVLALEDEKHGRRKGPRAAAHYWMAVAYGAKGLHAEAVANFEIFDRMVKDGHVDPTYLEDHWERQFAFRMVSSLLISAGSQSSTNKRTQLANQALPYAETLCELAPEDSFSWWLKADCQRFAVDIEGAVESFRKTISLSDDPANKEGMLHEFGMCLLVLGKAEEADEIFLKELEASPANVHALTGRATSALILLRKGAEIDPKVVLECSNKALEILKGRADATSLHLRSRVLVSKAAYYAIQGNENQDEQEQLLMEAMSLNPTNIPTLLELAQVFKNKGQEEKAQELIQKAQKLAEKLKEGVPNGEQT